MTFSLHKLVGLPAIAAAAFFMQALDATILNTALPAVARSLDRSPLAMQLAVVGYTLTVAMLIPVSGWLADRFGTRRVFISAVNFFILGSLLCALSTSLPMLVASRVLWRASPCSGLTRAPSWSPYSTSSAFPASSAPWSALCSAAGW